MKTIEHLKEGPREMRHRPLKTTVNALTIMTMLAAPFYIAGCHPNKESAQQETAGEDAAHTKLVQRELKKLGYNVSVDGAYGPQTRKAIVRFQHANGLIETGRAGYATEMLLGEAVGKKEGHAKRRKDEGFIARNLGDIGEAL